MRLILILLLLIFYSQKLVSQINLNVQYQSEIESVCTQMIVTMMHDQTGLPYLYVANKEAGMKIYSIQDISNPVLVATISTSHFLGMEVINLTQQDQFIYLALGNIWNTDSSGMAIVDVQDPLHPVVTDYYFKPNSTHGSGIVKVVGDFAYLGAMQDGLIVLNIADKNNIQFVSQFIPDVNFPINNPNNLNIYNVRGMEVRNDTIYTCFDGGGIRIIDVSDKQNPTEIGRYCNPAMYSPMDHPKAYNNIVIKDSLAFVAVDYCGVEILNISDPSNIKLRSWWNPYGCPNNNWFTSNVHANEIRYDEDCQVLFLSTGKSDLYVLDVSDHMQPDSIYNYGGVNNNLGSWGVNRYQNQIYLSYICVPWPYIPFQSDSTLLKILTYNTCSNSLENIELIQARVKVYPNPFQHVLKIDMKEFGVKTIRIYSLRGEKLFEKITDLNEASVDLNQLDNGMYLIEIQNENDPKIIFRIEKRE